MLYEEARVYLDHVSKYGSVLGLDSIKNLLEELGNPQNDLRFIHIAGTNGKGSILAYVSTVLKEAGYRTGRYISPTVMDYMERFQINGEYMQQEELGELTEQVKDAAERIEQRGEAVPTVFEQETAISFLFFKKHRCDFVVLETGLGGNLDATNIVEKKEVCVFANISKDHMGFLGENLEQIAENKAGIIKPGAVVVTGIQCEEVETVLKRKASEEGCKICEVQKSDIVEEALSLEVQRFSYKDRKEIEISLLGVNQIENAAVAIEVIEALRQKGYQISEEALREGLKKTVWPGRFTVAHREPLILIDGAHNEDAARRLSENLNRYLPGKRFVAIMGVFKDKEFPEIIENTKDCIDHVLAIELPDKERTLSGTDLVEAWKKHKIKAETVPSMKDAIDQALSMAGTEKGILIYGSLSYLGEAIRVIQRIGD